MKLATRNRPWSIMLRSSAITALLGASLTARAEPPYEVLLVRGTVSDNEQMFFEAESTGAANPEGVIDELCNSGLLYVAGMAALTGEDAGLISEILGYFGDSDDGSSRHHWQLL